MTLRQAAKLYRRAIQGYPLRGTTWQRMFRRIGVMDRKLLLLSLWFPGVGTRERMREWIGDE